MLGTVMVSGVSVRGMAKDGVRVEYLFFHTLLR